jgi:hypothetical protein
MLVMTEPICMHVKRANIEIWQGGVLCKKNAYCVKISRFLAVAA